VVVVLALLVLMVKFVKLEPTVPVACVPLELVQHQLAATKYKTELKLMLIVEEARAFLAELESIAYPMPPIVFLLCALVQLA